MIILRIFLFFLLAPNLLIASEILQNKKFILDSGKFFSSQTTESGTCPDINTYSFFEDGTFEVTTACHPNDPTTGSYEIFSGSDASVKIETQYTANGGDWMDYLYFNFKNKNEISTLENVLISWNGSSNLFDYSVIEVTNVEGSAAKSNSEKPAEDKNNAITFLKVNHNMTNFKKAGVLEQEGYNCAELAGNFACAKGDSKIQILSERVQFNCNSYNGCAYKESDVISSLEKNFGIDISSTEIISSYSGDYRATCGDGPDGDRICVVENNGTDVWLFKGSLGASGMKF